jgi:hypothetical protein
MQSGQRLHNYPAPEAELHASALRTGTSLATRPTRLKTWVFVLWMDHWANSAIAWRIQRGVNKLYSLHLDRTSKFTYESLVSRTPAALIDVNALPVFS